MEVQIDLRAVMLDVTIEIGKIKAQTLEDLLVSAPRLTHFPFTLSLGDDSLPTLLDAGNHLLDQVFGISLEPLGMAKATSTRVD
jgi:hypothetical protein